MTELGLQTCLVLWAACWRPLKFRHGLDFFVEKSWILLYNIFNRVNEADRVGRALFRFSSGIILKGVVSLGEFHASCNRLGADN